MAKTKTSSRAAKAPADGKAPKTVIVGARVRELRELRGWSQLELAYRAHLHPTDVSKMEHGRKDYYTARFLRLAVALGTSADYLLGLSDEAKPAKR